MTHPRISAEEAHRMMTEQGYLYLDVRTEAEFAQGHPQGAYNVPIKLASPQGMTDNPRFLEVVSAAFDKQQKLVIGCKAGPRSKLAAERMIAAGYSAIAEQRAGFAGQRDAFGRAVEPGWQAAGLPTAVAPEPGHDYAALAAKRGS
jgi:rhodanese-related sulfurtransferase